MLVSDSRSFECRLFPTIRTLACDRFPVLCDVLRQFAPCAGTGLVSSSQVFALVLTVVLLLANAFWSVLFFRWRDLRASFIAFVPYALLVAALVILLARTDPLGAILLSFYCIYLIYATRWGYHLWRLNTANALTRHWSQTLAAVMTSSQPAYEVRPRKDKTWRRSLLRTNGELLDNRPGARVVDCGEISTRARVSKM